MPCAATDYSCNSLITVRSPLGEVRLGARGPTTPRSSTIAGILHALRAAADWLACDRLRHEGHAVDPRLLDDFAVSDPETARELRDLLGL